MSAIACPFELSHCIVLPFNYGFSWPLWISSNSPLKKRALGGLSETSRKYNTFKGQDVCECLVFAKFATMRKRQHAADHNDQQLVTDCSLWLIESQTKDQVTKRIKDKKWSTKYYTENSRVCYTTPTKTREWAQGLPFYLHECFCASFLFFVIVNQSSGLHLNYCLSDVKHWSINQSIIKCNMPSVYCYEKLWDVDFDKGVKIINEGQGLDLDQFVGTIILLLCEIKIYGHTITFYS